jgi:peptide/nickel transport system ATP-binding protein
VSAVAVEPVVRVENLCLGLQTGEPVVDGVTFSVAPGAIVGLVGESGSGKTTTALSLLGYTRRGIVVRGGTVEVGGESVLGRDRRSLRGLRGNTVSYVPQDPGGALNPSMRVGDAILDVLRAHRRGDAPGDSVRAALERVELGRDPRFAGRYPHQLSGGQQQRVTIAMACVCDPPVAVLDEPTTGLDVRSGLRIMDPLRRLMAGRTTIVISHNLLTVRDATLIVVLDRGRVAESGTHDDLLARGGTYARLHRLNAVAGPAGTGAPPPGTVTS